MVDLHLRESMKSFDDAIVTAWVSKMTSVIVEAFNEIAENEPSSTSKWTSRDLMAWVDSLKHYPQPEKEHEVTNYLIDASRRLYRPKYEVEDDASYQIDSISNFPIANQ